MTISEQHVAFEMVLRGSPQEGATGGSAQEGLRGEEVAVACEQGHGLGIIRVHADEVADVGVLERGEIRGRRPRIGGADEQFGRFKRTGQRLKVAVAEIEISVHEITVFGKFLRAAVAGGDLHGEFTVVIVREAVESDAQLPQVAFANDPLRTFFSAVQGREQQRREDGNDADDHQQFHQRESVRWPNRLRGFHRNYFSNLCAARISV